MGTFHFGPVIYDPRQGREGAFGDLRLGVPWQGEVQSDAQVMADAKRLNKFGFLARIAEAVDVAAWSSPGFVDTIWLS